MICIAETYNSRMNLLSANTQSQIMKAGIYIIVIQNI